MTTTIYNARVFTGDAFLENATITIENQTITSVSPSNETPPANDAVNLQGLCLAPALIDLQVYGGNGKLFNNEPTAETIEATWRSVSAGGGAYFQITLSCSPLETMWQAMDACREYWANGGHGLIGLHLEGPFFNPEKRGAHPLEHIRKPEPAVIQTILEWGKDVVTYMTLAPEQFTDETLDPLLASDILLSAGHSNATYHQALWGIKKGIGRVTHLFNAMSQLQSRAPGLVGAAYDFAPWTSIIADGIHCDYAALRISKKILQDQLFLITDAVTNSEMGDYRFRFAGDRYVDANGTLAGSALTMWQAVQNAIRLAGIEPAEALRMASTYPARVMGRGDTLGKIAPGYEAKFVLFDDEWNLVHQSSVKDFFQVYP